MVRDGYTYVIIGRQDLSHPSPDPTSDFYPVSLEVCHNLPRVISSFDNDRKSDSFTSAVTSFDILANFTGLPVTVLDELHGTLDDPSNGLLLAGDAHKAFDQFYWCLKPTETSHVYSVEVIRTKGFPRGAGTFFDDLLDDYKDDEDKVHPIQCWLDLERTMEESALRDSVAATLRSVQVS